MNKSVILLAALLTTANSYGNDKNVPEPVTEEFDEINQTNPSIQSDPLIQFRNLKKLLEVKPEEQDQNWKVKVDKLIERLYIDGQLRHANESPPCTVR